MSTRPNLEDVLEGLGAKLIEDTGAKNRYRSLFQGVLPHDYRIQYVKLDVDHVVFTVVFDPCVDKVWSCKGRFELSHKGLVNIALEEGAPDHIVLWVTF